MAAALAMTTAWLPQDDLLLKKSVEAGASLESLARGAVEFSRKFTIKELQDRWWSLLYDPAISAQACARMAELELSVAPSKSKKGDNSKENNLSNGKRKFESIRNSYYVRKRVCKEPHYHGDLMDNPFINEVGNCMLEDPFDSNFGMDDNNFDILYDTCPSVLGYGFLDEPQNTLGDQVDQTIATNEQLPNLPGHPDMIGGSCRSQELCGHDFFEVNNVDKKPIFNSKDEFSGCEIPKEHLSYSPSSPEMAAWDAVGTMLLLEVPDVRIDSTGNNVYTVDPIEGTCADTAIHLPSVLTDPMSFDDISDIRFTNEDEMQVIDDGTGEIIETSLNLSTFLEDELEHDDEVSSINLTLTSTATFDPRFPEYRYGVICCVLNTEDPEIPFNDDSIFPSKRPASGSHKKAQNRATVPSSCGKDQAIEKGLSSMTMEPKPIKKSHSMPNVVVGLNCAGNDLPETQYDCDGEIAGQMAESTGAEMNVVGMNQAQQIPSALDFAARMLQQDDNELVSSEREEFVDSDEDIPSYSDVEAMILDMDLGPADHNPLCASKIKNYQEDHAMKAIRRLEQNAHSHMQRNMESRGAFAVLFGRHSKHYIKKPEILLGRATDGVYVDIDLTKEGHPRKISRRQASIKMNRDGTFSLKNLAKSPIYVNNEKLDRWQCLDLCSDCLIEIRGIAFIFEVNLRRVRLYLDGALQ